MGAACAHAACVQLTDEFEDVSILRRGCNGFDPADKALLDSADECILPPFFKDLRLEDLLCQLFSLHDLDGNGLLEESELIQLNITVALLHKGEDVDLLEVEDTYRTLFREKLDPDGNPIKYSRFRSYVLQLLDGIDEDPRAQEMMMEQFVAEARLAREVRGKMGLGTDLLDRDDLGTP
eukprot:gb/GFBE01032695.1/.p1 GENE.gb/GFBE01032695.1/~~gb/GFBE01032695.1/.p1  ORF type:complete len:179 (+),score=42.76 gb/GFBE01032695.1/:1-537(+)